MVTICISKVWFFFFLFPPCFGIVHCAVMKLQMTRWDLSQIHSFFTSLASGKHPVLLPVYLTCMCVCACVCGTVMAAHLLIDPASWSRQQNARVSKPWSGMSICKLLSKPAGNWQGCSGLLLCSCEAQDQQAGYTTGKAWLSWGMQESQEQRLHWI